MIGERIDDDFDQLVKGHGYDHNWCLSHIRGDFGLSAQIFSEKSGRAMDVYTDQQVCSFTRLTGWSRRTEKKGRSITQGRVLL